MGTSANSIDFGVGVHEIPGSVQILTRIRELMGALRAEFAKPLAGNAGVAAAEGLKVADNAAKLFATDVNVAIGAFQQLGRTVQLQSGDAVRAFRAEAEALAVELKLLGATDAQLKSIATTVANVEQRVGRAGVAGLIAGEGQAQQVVQQAAAAEQAAIRAANAQATAQRILSALGGRPIIAPIPVATISSLDQVAPKMRTAANAASLLAISAASGTGSLNGMANALGNVAVGVGAFVTGAGGPYIILLGAIVTAVAAVVASYKAWSDAQEKVKEEQRKFFENDPVLERAVDAQNAIINLTRSAADEAKKLQTERVAGATAARRLEIQQEYNAALQSKAITEATETDRNAAIVELRNRRNQQLAKLEADRARAEKDAAKKRSEEILDLEDKAALSEAQAARLRVEREFQSTIEAIGEARQNLRNDKTLSPDDFKKQNAELDVAVGQAGRRRALLLNQITVDSAKERAKLELDANVEILNATGQQAAASRLQIEAQYQQMIDTLRKKGVDNAEGLARDLFNANAAKIATDESQRTVNAVFDRSQDTLTRVGILLKAHAISAEDARQQTVAALTAERQALLDQLPALERLNELFPGNEDTLSKIRNAKTQILGLTADIQRASDRLAEIKETARGATTDAIAGFLQGLTKIGTQDRSQIRALAGDLHAAQAELNELLAIPAQQRTGEVNTRISQLRGEIASTTAQLEDAKSSITSWRDLFVSALQSIADALVRVSSQMLATAIIEKILGVGTLGTLSPTGPALSGGPIGGGGAVNVASGGYITGPGTGTSDSVPARLSNGEYVIRASRVQSLGREFFDAINFAGQMPRTPRFARYADGGYVQSATMLATARPETRDQLHVMLESGLIGKLVRQELASDTGRDIVVKHVTGNGRQLGLR